MVSAGGTFACPATETEKSLYVNKSRYRNMELHKNNQNSDDASLTLVGNFSGWGPEQPSLVWADVQLCNSPVHQENCPTQGQLHMTGRDSEVGHLSLSMTCGVRSCRACLLLQL